MLQKRWRQVSTVGVFLSMLLGCGAQARYMRSWQPVEGYVYRWTGGTLHEQKFTPDEAAAFAQFGTPQVIRFFRSILTRQHVYEWIYTEQGQSVWFVDGQRVEYVAVDTQMSSLPQASRDVMQEKFIAGGALASAVGGIAAGFIVLGETIGLRE
jgi:hypothetical protein